MHCVMLMTVYLSVLDNMPANRSTNVVARIYN